MDGKHDDEENKSKETSLNSSASFIVKCIFSPVNLEQNLKDYGEANETNHLTEDGRHLYGDHETQESEGGEADLHKHKNGCKKNPGHLNFIPVDTFHLKHLPEGFRDNDLYEWIKGVADLIVRVDVEMTSPHRPEFWPRTNSPYPFYNLRGKSVLKTGTGMVQFMEKFTDGRSDDVMGGKHLKDYTKCWCTKCKISDHPSSIWWQFIVSTATHVVFDNIEAGHTTLRLFYDKDDSSVDIKKKVSVSGISYVNIEYDRCELRCVTCDEKIGGKLYRFWRHYRDVRRKVRNKYMSSRDRHRMTFIVSHPHGCSKQVSVGQWKDMYEVDNYYKKCTYQACTCPGSSGARVFCVGFDDDLWYNELVHSGYKSGLNFSGIGWLA